MHGNMILFPQRSNCSTLGVVGPGSDGIIRVERYKNVSGRSRRSAYNPSGKTSSRPISGRPKARSLTSITAEEPKTLKVRTFLPGQGRTQQKSRRSPLLTTARAVSLCARHVWQLGGESPLSNPMEVKD